MDDFKTYYNNNGNNGSAQTIEQPAVKQSAKYIGNLEYGSQIVELFNLLIPVGEHPIGSTVSRQTLEKYGVKCHLI